MTGDMRADAALSALRVHSNFNFKLRERNNVLFTLMSLLLKVGRSPHALLSRSDKGGSWRLGLKHKGMGHMRKCVIVKTINTCETALRTLA